MEDSNALHLDSQDSVSPEFSTDVGSSVQSSFSDGLLSQAHGPLSTIFQFLPLSDCACLRLVSRSFNEAVLFSLSTRQWTLKELFVLNSELSKTFRQRLTWRNYLDISARSLGSMASEIGLQVVLIRYSDFVSTDFQVRSFPLFIPRFCTKFVTLKIIEHLFVLVYGNWPFRRDDVEHVGLPVYWEVNGKGAEFLQFELVSGDSGGYDPSLSLREFLHRATETEGPLLIRATTTGIIHWSPRQGFRAGLRYGAMYGPYLPCYDWVTETEGQLPLKLTDRRFLLSKKEASEEKSENVSLSLADLVASVESGKLYPHFYEILSKDVTGVSKRIAEEMFEVLDVDLRVQYRRIMDWKAKKNEGRVNSVYDPKQSWLTVWVSDGGIKQRCPREGWRHGVYPMR